MCNLSERYIKNWSSGRKKKYSKGSEGYYRDPVAFFLWKKLFFVVLLSMLNKNWTDEYIAI